jgi:hypothetical protein
MIMADDNSNYVVFAADKFIGRSKPIIIVCYNTSNPRHWMGQWIVITDDEIQCSLTTGFDLGKDQDYELQMFLTPEQMLDQVASQAEGFFWQKFQTKHAVLWTRMFESNYPPRFLRLDEADGKSAIFRMLFVSQKSANNTIRDFGSRCGNKELAKFIEVGSSFKVSFGLEL